MSVPNFHRKCNIYVSRLIMCTVFCGNLCALFSNVCGDKNGFVVYNIFAGTERKTDLFRLDFYDFKRGGDMRVRGLQKLTLLDFPGKMGCTVFLGGCNFRCPFCQNSELILPGGDEYEIPEEDFFAFLKKRQGMLDGVCITGGEPLVNKNVDDFARRIKDMGYLVKLDTNGTFPDKLRALIDAGLVDYVAMDIKNFPEKYAETVGLEKFDMEPIFESVRLLMGGETDFEFRTTVVRELHSAEDFEKIGEWLKGDEKYFLQSFTDSDFVLQKGLSAHSRETLRTFADIVRKNVPRVEIRGV